MKYFRTTFLFFTLFGILPVGLWSVNNYNLLNTPAILILLGSFPLMFRYSSFKNHTNGVASRMVLVIIITIFISYIFMVINFGKFTSWIIVACLYYLMYWIILEEVKTINDIKEIINRVKIFILIASSIMLVFYIYPNFLEGPLANSGMGTYRGEVLGTTRIFVPSLGFMLLSVVYSFSRLLFSNPKNKVLLIIFILLELYILLVISSIRTYGIGLILTLVLMLFIKFKTNVIYIILSLIFTIFSVIVLLPSGISNFLDQRFNIIFDTSLFDFRGVSSGIFVTGNQVYGTLYWRISEMFFASQYINSFIKYLFGTMGQYYEFTGFYTTVPHISYFGIFYLFGFFGVFTFSVVIIYFTRKMIYVYRLYVDNKYRYLAIFAIFGWFNLLLNGLAGGVFYSENYVALVAGLFALTIILENNYKKIKHLYV